MQKPKPNEIYEEHSHLVQGFRRCSLLRNTVCPACGERLSPSSFLRLEDGAVALRCGGCHRNVFIALPAANPFELIR